MYVYDLTRDDRTGEDIVELPFTGSLLLEVPLFNKGSAFGDEEREAFNLLGLLPPHVSTIEEQVARRYEEYKKRTNDLDRHVFLRALQDRNEILFYRLVLEHISEMMPVIYTPTVGAACEIFSQIYCRPRGLFISYPERHRLDAILANRPYREVDVIVVTDGERILGLGDQGVGGMGIPVGKLSLYTLCGGIHPSRTLPIILDAGTDNPERLRDPLYIGWGQPRVRGQEYDRFIEMFVQAVERQLPGVLLQWEDFAQPNARPILERYRNRLCTFNDDIQGTAAVALGALLSALKVTGSPLREQRLVVVGAGSAGVGISDLIVAAMVRDGLSAIEARSRFWLVDRHGLLHDGLPGLERFQLPYAHAGASLAGWQRDSSGQVSLLEVVRRVQATALIGVSGQAGLFSEEVVRTMAANVVRPIIFPLSNPTSRSEASPADLMAWTGGRALVATGSPFAGVDCQGRKVPVSQCNNSYIFPGLGLGVVAAKAARVTETLFLEAAAALSECSPACNDFLTPLLPPLEDIRRVSRHIALRTAVTAQREGLTPAAPATLEKRIDAQIWEPRYPIMRFAKTRK
jgi:malate dehydrogenase (oxaloacetate-decarboxylating)